MSGVTGVENGPTEPLTCAASSCTGNSSALLGNSVPADFERCLWRGGEVVEYQGGKKALVSGEDAAFVDTPERDGSG